MTYYVDPSAGAPIPVGAATEATLLQVLARATASNANEAATNTNLTSVIAKLQEIIDTRKPYQLIPAIDIRSYARANVTTKQDGRTEIEIAEVWEGGSQTGVSDVNWGLDNINGTGNVFAYDPAFNGTHTVTVLGANGQTFKRTFNHQNRKGIDTGTKVFYLTESIYGDVDAQDYYRLTVADASGAVSIADVDLQLNVYTPALPDTGKNKYFLHKPIKDMFIQPRQEELSGGGVVYSIPPNRVNSYQVWTEQTGVDFDVSIDGGSTFINYNNSRPFGGFSAVGGYLNHPIEIRNNGSRVVIATLS